MLHQNFAYQLEKRALLHPADIAVFDAHDQERWTYRELVQRSCRLAHALASRGVARGDRVCCLTKNSVEYLDLFLAVARLGAIVCPINHRLAMVEVKRIVEDARPKALVCDTDFAEAAEAIVREHACVTSTLAFGEGALPWGERLEDATRGQPDAGPAIAGDPEDPLLMLYTAGSTGRPKGVPITGRNLFFSASNWIVELGLRRTDYTLSALPLFHIGGHVLWTLPHLMIGAKVLLLRRFEPEAFLRIIERERVTNTYLIPAMAKMVIASPQWRRHDLGSLRFVGSGGEAVPESVAGAFREIGIPILNSYGLTETSDGTTSLRPYDAGKPAHCIGKPLPFVDVKLVTPEGREAAPGEEGEIAHQGPTLVDGYWGRPEETAKAFRDGWFFSGDVGVRDEDGYLYFLGRKDDMIVTGGENVYPAEVEQAILSHPKVADVAVLGVPDERWGQAIKAIIAPRGGALIDEKELAKHLEVRLSRFKRPRIWRFVDQLPKIGSGKLDRNLIRKTHGQP